MRPEEINARRLKLVSFFAKVTVAAKAAARHASAGSLDAIDPLLEEIEANLANARIHIDAMKKERTL